MNSTVPTAKKSHTKLLFILSLGILIPVTLIALVFFAAKNDAENQKEYDRIRQQQAEKIEFQKQQQKIQQAIDTKQTVSES
ncbi:MULTISPECIES: hypothetical protein [Acinetobacter]|uniref:Uncharacterized protein n=1 Tax=Acinetobacter piscicola TaxID=2006115 RepID=A0A7S6VV23_9GAMM|nr:MULTISPECIES: hypothetical protein [Acinetobacter]MDM1756160.1 hypothetical protein [Acinetobacter sp. 256-1]QOW45328.1 hypothetical protein G0028_05160 [Acinetobacter piscicola]